VKNEKNKNSEINKKEPGNPKNIINRTNKEKYNFGINIFKPFISKIKRVL